MEVSHSESINLAKTTLEKLDVLSLFNPKIFYPRDYVNQLRDKGYKEQWEICIRNYWYHMHLFDGSLLVFDENSFRYLMSPVTAPTREDFLHFTFGLDWDAYSDSDKNEYLSSSSFAMDFQSYVDSVSQVMAYTPVRYDMSLDDEQYCRLTHPAFHLHIGFENKSRIPVKVKMTPFAFSMFILSTFYPDKWRDGINNGYINSDLQSKLKNSLETIGHIKSNLWCDVFEQNRIHIG